jgi:Family of unknown function (DUF6448)
MPPHADSIDGPVVKAARDALQHEDVFMVYPFVTADQENELTDSYDFAIKARDMAPEVERVAARAFTETSVRLHLEGRGHTYTGIKPAGTSPIVRATEIAVGTKTPSAVIDILVDLLHREAKERFEMVETAEPSVGCSIDDGRAYVDSVLTLEDWVNDIYKQIVGTKAV